MIKTFIHLILLTISCSNIAIASLEEVLLELNNSFIYKGKPVHPKIIKEFTTLGV